MRAIKRFFTIISMTAAAAFALSAQTSLSSLDGTHLDVQGQRGKVVILAIGASWLPLSNIQADYANALARKYAGRDVAVYYVVTDSSNSRSKNFADDNAIKKFAVQNKLSNVTVLRDIDGAATLQKFKIEQVPSFVILDKNGAQVGDPFGGVDPKYDVTIPISRIVDKLL
jgi:thiol-disulfide isomerase/thioredoxin